MIYCLAWTGKPISNTIKDVLFLNACEMKKSGDEKQFIKGKNYDGLIKSNFKPYSFGGMAVFIFDSELELEDSKLKIKYCIPTAEFDAEYVLATNKWEELPCKLEH